jgi:hypothetical protein
MHVIPVVEQRDGGRRGQARYESEETEGGVNSPGESGAIPKRRRDGIHDKAVLGEACPDALKIAAQTAVQFYDATGVRSI